MRLKGKVAIVTGSIAMWIGHLVLITGVSIWLGAFNQTPSARNEETLIGAFSGFLPLFFI